MKLNFENPCTELIRNLKQSRLINSVCKSYAIFDAFLTTKDIIIPIALFIFDNQDFLDSFLKLTLAQPLRRSVVNSFSV